MKNKSNGTLLNASTDKTVIAIAQICVDAMRIREESYNHEAYKLASEETYRKNKGKVWPDHT